MSNQSARRAMKILGVQPEGSSDEILSQQKLRSFEQLKDQRAAINKKYKDDLGQIENVLKSGASVSTGRRGVETGFYWQRHPSYKNALSEQQQKEVLQNTPYTPHYRMRFISKNGTNGHGKE